MRRWLMLGVLIMLLGWERTVFAAGKTTEVLVDGVCYQLAIHTANDRFTPTEVKRHSTSEHSFWGDGYDETLYQKVELKEIHLIPCQVKE